MGGGCTLALTTIIVSDLVSLAERGAFNGILGLSVYCSTTVLLTSVLDLRSLTSAFCISGGIAPVVGGALAQEGQWRWIFCKPPCILINANF